MKQTIAILSGLLLLAATAAQAQYDFNVTNGLITITKYTGSNGAVIIPTNINGMPVTRIGYFAFSQASVTNVTIPDGVNFIEDYAFANCGSLTNVTISDTVTGIGSEVFYSCTSMTNFTFPDSVTNLGGETFYGCNNLTNVTFGAGLTSISFGTFSHCSGLTSFTIPSNITSIEEDAFQFCNNLTKCTIPNTLTSIGENAFQFCYKLTNFTIPASITNVGGEAFSDCPDLTGLFLQGNAPTTSSGSIAISPTIIYYLPGTTGWSNFFSLNSATGLLWNPLIQTSDGFFGLRSNQFGFNITGTTNIPIVVQACSNLANPLWTSLTNVNLTANGLFYFGEPLQTNGSARYYRISSP